MSRQDQINTIQEMVKDIKYTMLTTRTGNDQLHSCPMNTVETSFGAKEIWLIGHTPSDTVDNIKKNNEVNLAYRSDDNKAYLSVAGVAHLVEDKDKLDELWSPVYNAFFEHGKDDPKVQIIKVVPHGAEYWHNGNAVANAVKIGAAAVSTAEIKEGLGENFSIEF